MKSQFRIYNTLSRQKEDFEPLNPPFAGLYVCGPTVYSSPHLGHARVNIVFDVLYRYLKQLGFRVRYVRNITDVGHLENEEADTGEDKISKKARQEHLEPMEIVQKYMNSFHRNMKELNTLEPDIEPRATGHIIEQQQLISRLLEAGIAYESNSSVYFDVNKYNEEHDYGALSGRVLEDLMSNTRELEGQDEKRNVYDFALWKKASPGHIMKWPSPWSVGFPGWHLECSAMSMKYLGEPFDIHGGGMDLIFPHHECEIAQSTAALHRQPVKYWVHNNMITINGQKMARSLGNFITLDELWSGDHEMLERAYEPMTIRFFILQAHYRSTLDFSNEALQAAEKGFKRMMEAIDKLDALKTGDKSTIDVDDLSGKAYAAMNDDLNTPVMISHLFDGVRMINSVFDGNEKISAEDLGKLKDLYGTMVFDILGLKKPGKAGADTGLTAGLIETLLELRRQARDNKDFATSDRIRDRLTELGVTIKDTKEGTDWTL
ncbi:MAG: cysteine--tRNA ligase [Bacteroidales bacterium]|nr:cysteine--tRNA ligase [Bacteroidales bacterium]